MVFNAPVALIDSLRATGFDVVSVANNHVYDQGRKGLVETLITSTPPGSRYVGAGGTCAEARKARIFELDGLRVAMLGATDLFNDPLNAGPDDPAPRPSTSRRSCARSRGSGLRAPTP